MEPVFIVTEEQRAILETVARFVKEEVTPRAARLDAEPDPAAGFSWEIVDGQCERAERATSTRPIDGHRESVTPARAIT